MQSKSRLKQRLARLFQASTLLRSPCNYSTASSSIFSSSAAGTASSRLSISTDIAVEPVFLPRNERVHNPVLVSGKIERSLSLPGRLDCGGCRPTRTSSETGLLRNIRKCDEKKKKKERRVRETGGFYETGEGEGNACPPASPTSPKNNYYYYNQCFEKANDKSKKKSRKKLLSNGYGFSSSSSEEGFEFFSSNDDDDEKFFSSRSFSSDSSSFYNRPSSSSSKKKNQKSSRRPPTHRRIRSYEGFQPAVSMTTSKTKAKEEAKSGFPVTKRSREPYIDFRDSMVEMIVERQIFGTKGLENLLHSYLSLNSPNHHPIILRAFADISEVLFGH